MEKIVSEIFGKIHRKTLAMKFYCHRCMPATLLKIELDWHSCPANFTKYFRKVFSIENFLRLLLLLIFFEAKQSGTKQKNKKKKTKKNGPKNYLGWKERSETLWNKEVNLKIPANFFTLFMIPQKSSVCEDDKNLPFNPFHVTHLVLHPPENIRKPEFVWRFQGVLKETIGTKWVNAVQYFPGNCEKLLDTIRIKRSNGTEIVKIFVLFYLFARALLRRKWTVLNPKEFHCYYSKENVIFNSLGVNSGFGIIIYSLAQPGFTCSKLTIETLEQCVKYV